MSRSRMGVLLIGAIVLMMGCSKLANKEVEATMEEALVPGEIELRIEEKKNFYSIYASHHVQLIDGPEGIRIVEPETGNIYEVNTADTPFIQSKDTVQLEGLHVATSVWAEKVGTLEKQYAISPDGSRLAYFEDKAERVMVYHKGSNRSIEISLDDFSMEYRENIQLYFSPNGKYITVAGRDTSGDKGFQSFGSQSGKKAHELIKGDQPLWSNNERYVAFLAFSNGSLLAEGIGIYTISNKNITYIQGLEEGDYMMYTGQWVGNDTALLFVGRNKALYHYSVYLYSLGDRVMRAIEEEHYDQSGKGPFIKHTALSGNQLIYSLVEEERGLVAFKVHRLDGTGEKVYDKVSPFNYHRNGQTTEVNYILLDSRWVLYLQENYVYITNEGNSKCILKEKGKVESIQWLEANEMLAFYIQGEEERHIVLYPLENMM